MPVQVLKETMGTYYRISFTGDNLTGLKDQIDSLLVALNEEVSTYIPTSTISRFNYGDLPELDAVALQQAPHFYQNVRLSWKIATLTQQYFNPTVMPLVNYWGFGYTEKRPVTTVDSAKIDSILQFVGMECIALDTVSHTLRKQHPSVQLDFSAIAKGYGVDLVADFLQNKGINNYLVDIGGEVVAKGNKGNSETPWRIGVAVPLETSAVTDYQIAVSLVDAAVATSGNYRNFYEAVGQKFSHTINPKTGFPERSNLLSTSILAADCATADALATACMVAGLEKAYQMIDTLQGIEACFIYADEQGQLQTRMTKGFEAIVVKE
ncbi:MAG: FAD:protein FMN transferase [Saprospiraceae bacterium]